MPEKPESNSGPLRRITSEEAKCFLPLFNPFQELFDEPVPKYFPFNFWSQSQKSEPCLCTDGSHNFYQPPDQKSSTSNDAGVPRANGTLLNSLGCTFVKALKTGMTASGQSTLEYQVHPCHRNCLRSSKNSLKRRPCKPIPGEPCEM